MRTICLIDTSILCNVLKVPQKSQDHGYVIKGLRDLLRNSTALLLPMATIIETGNHIAQQGSGRQRRQVATKFVEQVCLALEGKAPWKPTSFLEVALLVEWLRDFPDCATRGVGLGDLSIIKEFERMCQLNPGRRVYIWSLDQDLLGYDRTP